MKFSIIAIAAVISIGGVSLSCSSHADRNRAMVESAVELGRYHARELCRLAQSDADLCPVLLDIKAKESEMRMHGLDELADSMLQSVEKEVAVSDPALAEELFKP